jgi:hypothetical protein
MTQKVAGVQFLSDINKKLLSTTMYKRHPSSDGNGRRLYETVSGNKINSNK